MFSLSVIGIDDPPQVIPAPARTQRVVTGDGAAASGRWVLSWESAPDALIRFAAGDEGWSVWADHVTRENPVVLPQLGVAVGIGEEDRDLTQILSDLGARDGTTQLQRIAAAPEDSLTAAMDRSVLRASPTWLGLARDYRLFALGFNGIGAGNAAERIWDWIAPQWHGRPVTVAEADGRPVRFHYMFGRGQGSVDTTRRRLQSGRLPILEALRDDGGISYEVTAFVGREAGSLRGDGPAGTPYLLADGQSEGHMFTPEQQEEHDRLAAATTSDEETVLYLRVRAANRGAAPAYAFLKLPEPHTTGAQTPIHDPVPCSLDPASGMLRYETGRVALVAVLGGVPVGEEEIARLLQPGESIDLDVRIPHQAVDTARAARLQDRDFDEAHEDCAGYWEDKLDSAAAFEVPDERIQAMIAAGLLHLDLVTYGEEPRGAVAPTIGIYAPIGSESGPIIQFYDSVGWSDLAERSLDYFFEKQRENGFMQNFGGYMLETEAALWSIGEHFRYTRDGEWARRVFPKVEKAVSYILSNRQRSRDEGVPFGLLVGKTSDPEDPFASFMLNGFASLGLSRAAELADAVGSPVAGSWVAEQSALAADTRAALADAVAGSPVVPLGDGRWGRTAPPWAGEGGPVALRRDGSKWYTHGTFFARDSLNGPLWLMLQEVLDPTSPLGGELLEYAAELHHVHNGALSQPYYSEHALAHLRRGEVKEFLSAYFTSFVGLADPETHSFWEHYFHASPHKTHEEAWFLLQTRWMLYLEDGDERLRLLPGVPREWLRPGKHVGLRGARSYFGAFDACVAVGADGALAVEVTFAEERAPAEVVVRVPHPEGRTAVFASAGTLDPVHETLTIPVHGGRAEAIVRYGTETDA